jgi:hypothetical protein
VDTETAIDGYGCALWVDCEDCGLLEHPDMTCDEAAWLVAGG